MLFLRLHSAMQSDEIEQLKQTVKHEEHVPQNERINKYFSLNGHTQYSPRRFLVISLTPLIFLFILGSLGFYIFKSKQASKHPAPQSTVNSIPNINLPKGSVKGALVINVPTEYASGLTVTGDSVFQGTVTAPNLLYSIRTGNGIASSGGQQPTLSNSGVLSLNGKNGDITIVAGSGLSVEGFTLENTDKGSEQNIFKTIRVSGNSFSADSNSDMLTLLAGAGIELSTNAANKSITISGAQGDSGLSYTATNGLSLANASIELGGLLTSETIIDLDGHNFLLTGNGNIGIGSTTPQAKLHVVGDQYIEGSSTISENLEVLGSALFAPQISGADTLTLRSSTSSPGLLLNATNALGDTLFTIDSSGNASSAGVLTLVGGTIQTTKNQVLTIGGDTSGPLILKSKNSIVFQDSGVNTLLIGNSSGNSLTSGFDNTLIGSHAGYTMSVTTSSNTFIGSNAGYAARSSVNNTFIGADAARYGTDGHFNTIVGQGAGKYNEGSYNTLLGFNAGFQSNNISAAYNTFLGSLSGSYNTTGRTNIAIGYQSGYSNTIGSSNIFIGYQSGITDTGTNTSGNNNIFIGRGAGPGTSTQLSSAGAIGYKAIVSQSNSLVLGGIGENAISVGIGTPTPIGTLNIEGSPTGKALVNLNYTGSDQNLFTASSSGSTKFVIANNGNVGINNANPNYSLDVTGSTNITGNTTFGSTLTLSQFANCTLKTDASGNLTCGSDNTGEGGAINAWSTTGNDLYYTLGNVGIGTSEPTSDFHVNRSDGTTAINISNTGATSPTTQFASIDFKAMNTFGYGNWQTAYDTSENSIRSFVLDSENHILYAGSANSGIMYRCDLTTNCDESTDWTISYDTDEAVINSLTFDAANHLLFASSSNNGRVYRCDTLTGCDAASDWTIAADFTETGLNDITVDTTHSVVYVATGANGKIYRCDITTSCDTTADWSTAFTTVNESYILSLVFDPTNGVLYAGAGTGTADGVVYRCAVSTGCDANSDWTLTLSSGDTMIQAISVDTTQGIVFVGTYSLGKIFTCPTSSNCDAQADWTEAYDTPTNGIMDFTIDTTDGYIYAATHGSGIIYRCLLSSGCNSANEWTTSFDATESVMYSIIYDTQTDTVYVGTNPSGIIYRLNKSFTPSLTNFAQIQSLALDTANTSEDGALLFNTIISGTSRETMRLASGNVGVGTTAPESRMQVTGGGLCVGSDANCNSDNNTEGVIYAAATNTTVYDVAENYPTKDTDIEAGDVVVLDNNTDVFVKKSTGRKNEQALGVVSAKPGLLLGGFNGQQFKEERQVAVGLSGRIPVKVTTENGPIKIGDPLALSSTPGAVAKATQTGWIVGRALENYDETNVEKAGQIMMYINSIWYSPIGESLATSLSASRSSEFTTVDNLPTDFADIDVLKVNFDLTVFGTTTLREAVVQDTIGIGSEMEITSNAINTLTQDFEIQPLKQAPIDFMAGAVRIEKDGTVTFAENTTFAKNIEVKGTATIKNIVIPNTKITTLSDTEVEASGSAGTLFIKAGKTIRKVVNPNVVENSLIYITAVSDTQGQAPYIAEQVTGDASESASFTVKINHEVSKDIKFNFLIINQH